MISIGIDPSINSTSVTILKNGEIHKILLIQDHKTHVHTKKRLPEGPFETVEYDKDTTKTDQAKTRNFNTIADILIDFIKEEIEPLRPKSIQVTIEGLSYGLKGNAIFDLAGLHYVITCRLSKELFLECKTIPPYSLKMEVTGNGGASKEEMINAFELTTCLKISKNKAKVDDLADSYWLAKVTFEGI